MKKSVTNPFDHQILDPEEQVIEDALENGEFESVGNLEDTKKMLSEAARQYKQLNTAKPITVRVNQLALIKLRARAKAKNIPYQTLLGVLINSYVEGKTELSL